MAIDSTVLPEKLLKLMSPEDRKKLGKSGMTLSESLEKGMEQREKEIQREISNYLRLHGIAFINPPMHRRSTLPEGWPDFTFCWHSLPFAVEVKTDAGSTSEMQDRMHRVLTSNGWKVLTVRSLKQLIDSLPSHHSTE